MRETEPSFVIHLSEAQAVIPGPAGEHSTKILERGTLDIRCSLAPSVSPIQTTPHVRDEIYVIVRGCAILFHDGKRDPFEAGDLLFVAAGIEHRFEEYSGDLTVWVVFHGPPGGE